MEDEIEYNKLTHYYPEDNVAEALQTIVKNADIVFPDRLFCLMSNGVEQVTAVCVASEEEMMNMIYTFLNNHPQFINPIIKAASAVKNNTK